ncbi:TPA: hypothetical protein RQN15_002206 [Aeromonas hydrophila]|nr:hypothetical protein [Aeromonas hydrophila]
MKVSLIQENNQVSVGKFDEENKDVTLSVETGAFIYGSEIMDATEEIFINVNANSITIFGYAPSENEGEMNEKEFLSIRNGTVSVSRSR